MYGIGEHRNLGAHRAQVSRVRSRGKERADVLIRAETGRKARQPPCRARSPRQLEQIAGPEISHAHSAAERGRRSETMRQRQRSPSYADVEKIDAAAFLDGKNAA